MSAGGDVISAGSGVAPPATAPPATGPSLGIASLPNLRDLGGHRTRDGGRVRTGLLYRSTDLTRISGDDAVALARLGIRSVYDLRTEEERTTQPDRLPPGAAYVAVDVLRDSPEASPAELMRLFANPRTAREILDEGQGTALWDRKYREFVLLGSARAGFGRLFAELADETNRPALFHCTTGKDRTGWAAAAFLLLLGVPDDAVMGDYLLSAWYLGPALQRALDAFRAQGGDPDLLAPIVAVRPEYLEAALEEMRVGFGSIEVYFDEGLGIDAATQRELRTAFVGRA
jgi:protein-tyrosine phosphatase